MVSLCDRSTQICRGHPNLIIYCPNYVCQVFLPKISEPHTWQQTIGYNCAKAKMLVFLFLLLLYRNFFPYFKLIFSTCFLTASLKGKYVFILIRKILLLTCIPITQTSTSITVIVTYGIFFFPAH